MIAAAFPDHERSRSWLKLVEQRIREQAGQLVSVNGVQREHSPDYQFRTLIDLNALNEFGS
jgi:hypothetical protein